MEVNEAQAWEANSGPVSDNSPDSDRGVVYPQCEASDRNQQGGLQMQCCVKLSDQCLSDQDCCQLRHAKVKCMKETDYFGNALASHANKKKCMIADECCSLAGTSEPCNVDADCCGAADYAQFCQKLDDAPHATCCRADDQKCTRDIQCCSRHCDPLSKACFALNTYLTRLKMSSFVDLSDSKLHKIETRMLF